MTDPVPTEAAVGFTLTQQLSNTRGQTNIHSTEGGVTSATPIHTLQSNSSSSDTADKGAFRNTRLSRSLVSSELPCQLAPPSVAFMPLT